MAAHITGLVVSLAALAGFFPATAFCRSAWPLWESYADHFIDKTGRVIDSDDDNRTTSEGQSYALFFALVADDRDRFQNILAWTEHNLTQGGLDKQLPSWLWGKTDRGGWGVKDSNSAADSDLWIAYDLIEAGRLWQNPHFTALGESMVQRIAQTEVLELPGFGSTLMPGGRGFRADPDIYELNPSYLPPQILHRLGEKFPQGPWKSVAAGIPFLVQGASPNGMALDWIAYHSGAGFSISPTPNGIAPAASYDAIRVYLWAGMMAPGTPGQKEILAALPRMAALIRRLSAPPAIVGADGIVKEANSGPGFAAATIPYLLALGETDLAGKQKQRLRTFWDARSGLYGNPPRYYDQNLALFYDGWETKRFSFDSRGKLVVPGRS